MVLETRSTSGLRWIETADLTDICQEKVIDMTEKVIDLKTFFEIFNCELFHNNIVQSPIFAVNNPRCRKDSTPKMAAGEGL